MDFGTALRRLQEGKRVTRSGWNGAGMWLTLTPSSKIQIQSGQPLGDAAPELVGTSAVYRTRIDIMAADGTVGPWLASQTDLLATDWHEVATTTWPSSWLKAKDAAQACLAWQPSEQAPERPRATDANPPQPKPSAALLQAAQQLHEIFVAYLEVGFTERQAISLLAAVGAETLRSDTTRKA